jgi:serine/threonine protein phosphatase PrpC
MLGRQKPLKMKAVGKTHVGRVRGNNEDFFCIDEELGLFLVADGMGGHASGEVASRMAVEILHKAYSSNRDRDPQGDEPFEMEERRLFENIQLANRAIHELSLKEQNYRGMGTTLAGILRKRDSLLCFHVGDSRIYKLHEGSLLQLTEDHSVVAQQVKMGVITQEQARTSRIRNVITRAIGVQWDVEADISVQDMQEGDIYMICTDGLSDFVPLETLERVLLDHARDLEGAAFQLVEEALGMGGQDNVTVVLVRLDTE